MNENRFDTMAKSLAAPTTRRITLRLLVGGLLGGLLASRGIGPVRAQADSDGDQLFDEDEINIYGTLPNNADTDGDQANDGLEIWNRDQGLGDPDDPLTPDNPAAPPPDPGPAPAATCTAVGGACSAHSNCCGYDTPNILCCFDANGLGTCTDVAASGSFLCPAPGVPDTGCAVGMTNCGGFCTDLSIDHGNCGVCGQSCPFGSNCTLGACVLYCGGGTTDCNGTCVDLQTDSYNCGSCGHFCGVHPDNGAVLGCHYGGCSVPF